MLSVIRAAMVMVSLHINKILAKISTENKDFDNSVKIPLGKSEEK